MRETCVSEIFIPFVTVGAEFWLFTNAKKAFRDWKADDVRLKSDPSGDEEEVLDVAWLGGCAVVLRLGDAEGRHSAGPQDYGSELHVIAEDPVVGDPAGEVFERGCREEFDGLADSSEAVTGGCDGNFDDLEDQAEGGRDGL